MHAHFLKTMMFVTRPALCTGFQVSGGISKYFKTINNGGESWKQILKYGRNGSKNMGPILKLDHKSNLGM